MKTINATVEDKAYASSRTVFFHEIESIEATFISDLILKWGMVAAIEDGEDSSGRSKIRLQTPQELVDRAFETAKIVFERFKKEDLLISVGPPDVVDPFRNV